MTECLEFARPMMRRGTGLNSHQAWWQLLEKRQDRAPLQLAADDHLASGINSVKTDLAMSNPIFVIVCMGRSSESWEP